MTIFFLVLLGTIIASSLAFGIGLFWQPLDDADFWLKILSAILAALIFLSGTAAVITGILVSKAQTVQTLTLEKEVADARTRQAKAESTLEIVRKRQNPRGLSERFREALKNAPTGEAVVVYVGGSGEVISFAVTLHEAMTGAGWQVPPPRQINSVLEIVPRAASPTETVIYCALQKGARGVPKHVQALYDALAKEGIRMGMAAALGMKLPDDKPHVIINPK
jgi:hypothetical protein